MFTTPGWAERIEDIHSYMTKDASAAAEAAREVGADLGPLGDLVRDYTGQQPI
jgi:hypothetical protein